MKLAQVGYGSVGQGAGDDYGGYTYIVNDNVKTGETIYPAVKHWKNGKIFGTTGVVLSNTKNFKTDKGKEIKAELDARGINKDDLANYYTQKESGAKRSRNAQTGRFNPNQKETLMQQTRGANIVAYQQQTGSTTANTQKVDKAVSEYAKYSKGYMPKPLYDPENKGE